MGVFQDVVLEWNGRDYTIPSHRVMGAIYKIEDRITLQEFQEYALRGTAPIGKLCGAYGAVLRYAGARVSDEEVYDVAFRGDGAQEQITSAIMNLIMLMLPPHARKQLEENGFNPSEDLPNPGASITAENSGKSKAAKVSSKQPSKRRSRKANG